VRVPIYKRVRKSLNKIRLEMIIRVFTAESDEDLRRAAEWLKEKLEARSASQ